MILTDGLIGFCEGFCEGTFHRCGFFNLLGTAPTNVLMQAGHGSDSKGLLVRFGKFCEIVHVSL